MKKTKKELRRTVEILERQRFLDVYSEFNKWLYSLGFRQGRYFKETSTPLDYHWSHYDKDIDSLHSVECYIHDTLNLAIRFLRDRHEHKFMFVGEMGSSSITYTIDQTKELILNDVRKLRDEQLAKLSALASF
jgi:hypothetical protein